MTYTFAHVGFGYVYEWEYSGTGFSIVSGDGTNSITAAFAPGATSGTLSVKSLVNGARSTALTKAITISPLPATPSAIAGNTSPSVGTANTYSVTAAANTTYQWSYNRTDATLTPNGASTSLDFSANALPGLLSVVAQNTCGNSSASTLMINVTPFVAPAAPTAFVTSSTNVCSGSTAIAYSVTPVNGVTYEWQYSGTGFTIASGDATNSIIGNFSSSSTSGTLSVKTKQHGLISSPLTIAIAVNSAPSAPGTIIGNVSPDAGIYLNGASSTGNSIRGNIIGLQRLEHVLFERRSREGGIQIQA